MRTQNSTRYSRSLTYSATAPRLKSMRFGATPNSYMPVGSTWSRHSVRKSWTPGGTEPLASSGFEAGADHIRARSPAVARTLMHHRRGCLRHLEMREVADASQHEPAMRKYS